MAASHNSSKNPFAFWLTVVFAVAIVGFGFYGFMKTYEATMGTWDLPTVYGKTVELFRPVPVIFVNGQKMQEHWALTVAQMLGRTFVVVAFIATVLAVFREYVSVILFRRARGHSIFIGLGRRGRALALAKARGLTLAQVVAQEARRTFKTPDNHPISEAVRQIKRGHKQRVAAIEWDDKKESAQTLRDAGALVLAGDGEDRSLLWKAKVSHAGQVFVLTGNDYTNLRVAEEVVEEVVENTEASSTAEGLTRRPGGLGRLGLSFLRKMFGWPDQRPETEVLVAVESYDLRSYCTSNGGW
jgi:hypothetical protein